ncbi:MAG: hypothetical protein PHW82_03175 [Bacteroidales bacterium]|nr:hypothetical protein [Bacteroidales bacterium]
MYPSKMSSKVGEAIIGYEYIIAPEQLGLPQQFDITDVRVEAIMNPFDFQINKKSLQLKFTNA